MKRLLKGKFIYLIITLIGVLLLMNIILTKYNNTIIKENKELQAETQKIKLYYDQIGKLIIHALDLGLRGYAIVQNGNIAKPMFNAVAWKDSIWSNVEQPLKKQDFNMKDLYVFEDSLNSYIKYCFYLKKLIDEGNEEEFLRLFSQDKGGYLWGQYVRCGEAIISFENNVNNEAQANYEGALRRNQILQIILFLISFPTLLYTAFYTTKAFRLSELLRLTEKDKNKTLTEKNTDLEKLVANRTKEIIFQNKQLQEAKKIIESQNQEIQRKNKQLELDVKARTEELQYANQQLIDHNSQLEQFSFITAHNLRAPLARILGLANLMEINNSAIEKEEFQQLIIASTRDLDQVIQDLNVILDIKKNTANLTVVELPTILGRVMKVLERECEETKAVITGDFEEIDKINAVAPYVESILYNLISNAIKYRNPNHSPVVIIKTRLEKEFICLSVSDNGLGIDLSRHKDNIFNLYKRFHLHMEGKGLGLHLVKTQIMALGGKVEVQSEPKKGTTFLLYFKA